MELRRAAWDNKSFDMDFPIRMRKNINPASIKIIKKPATKKKIAKIGIVNNFLEPLMDCINIK